MALKWMGGDTVRRTLAARELQAAGLSAKAAAALTEAQVFSVDSLLGQPWTDEEAGRRFVALSWRLSTAPGATPKIIAEIERVRGQLLEARREAASGHAVMGDPMNSAVGQGA